jgi:serine/threonine protein kinase
MGRRRADGYTVTSFQRRKTPGAANFHCLRPLADHRCRVYKMPADGVSSAARFMVAPTPTGTVCSTCGEPMDVGGNCLACLLRGGIEETVFPEAAVPPPVPLGYGDFEIARREDGSLWELGRGAMGVTYKAVDRVLHRSVALKVIQSGTIGASDASTIDALRERFLREARAAAALRHANVAGVFQFGASDPAGSWYYAMELVEGETLEARVRRAGPLAVGTALEIARQVAAALVAAAERGLIHRDLKPGNLMLSGHDAASGGVEVKVIDFGLAKAAATAGESNLTHGGFVGTPAFASPEQFAREPVDARSDLYSLGITLWYALTGEVPFRGRTLEEVRDPEAREHPPVERLMARGVPKCVISLLRRLLAVNPAGRPASATELMSALDECQAQLAAGKARPAAQRRLAVLALALATAGGAWWWAHLRASNDHHAVAAPPSTSPSKSVAVLPFDNFSEGEDSAFFADGMQDEVLTDLAKVADLKVISRASVMQYKDARLRNVHEIGQALNVAYVVEGSVQRVGNVIRVIAQLIDARTDTHKWAEHYDRDSQNLFTVQSEIAQAVAGQLQAVISPREHAAMEEIPTRNEQAYQLYLRAVGRWNDWDTFTSDEHPQAAETLSLLQQATARDPGFARAFAFMAEVRASLYGLDSTPADAALVRADAETVARLQPGSADAALAMGYYDDLVRHDFPRAQATMKRSSGGRPMTREPMKAWAPSNAGATGTRRCPIFARPSSLIRRTTTTSWPTRTRCTRSGDTRKCWRWPMAASPRIPSKPGCTGTRYTRCLVGKGTCGPPGRSCLSCLQRRTQAASRPTTAWSATIWIGTSLPRRAISRCVHWRRSRLRPGAIWEGDIARYRGDAAAAAAAYRVAQPLVEAQFSLQPKDAYGLYLLAKLDALQGRKATALAEGRRSVALASEDPLAVPSATYQWAKVLTFAGERDEAIRALQTICGQPEDFAFLPYGPEYGFLRLDPDWDPLRSDPRFQALVASMSPKP